MTTVFKLNEKELNIIFEALREKKVKCAEKLENNKLRGTEKYKQEYILLNTQKVLKAIHLQIIRKGSKKK